MAKVSFPGIAPFCYTETNNGSLVGSGTFYPVGLTLQEFCYLYWKVRGYNFVGTSLAGENSYSYNGCLPIGSGDFVFDPQSELDLVCDWTTTKVYVYTGEEGGGSWQIVLFFGGLASMPNLYFYNGLYWPWLQIQAPGASSGNIPTFVDPFGTCTFLGKQIDMFGNAGSLSLTITACAEWPYNP
jgi:hypothetical protein